jgi:hypothetical protein
MCSKPNPEENEVCQYCQARLKPLVVGQSPEPASDGESTSERKPTSSEQSPHPPPPTSSPTEDLSRLRSEYEELLPDLFPAEGNELDENQEPSTSSTYEEPESSDEYLGRLRDAKEAKETEAGPVQKVQAPSSEPDEPVPEWLTRIREKEGTRSQPDQPPEEDDGDWLTRLRQKEGTLEDLAEPVEEQPGLAEPEPIPDRSQSPGFEPAGQEAEVSPPADQVPTQAEPEASMGEDQASAPDWFSQSVPAEEESSIEPAEPGEMPDWLAEAGQETLEKEATGAQEQEASISPFASEPSAAEPSGEGGAEETPSWLAGELESDAGDEDDEEDSGSLSWLESEVDVNLEELDSGAFMAVEEDDQVELPGWLAEAVDPTQAAGAKDAKFDSSWDEGPPASGESSPDAETPSGEDQISGETPLGPASKPFVDDAKEPSSPPDEITWEKLKGGAAPAPDLDVPSRPFVESPEPEAEQPAEEADGLGLPAWLDEIRQPPSEPEQPPEESPAIIMKPGGGRKPKSEDSGLNLDDLELPEWIGEMRDEAASSAEGSPDLAPATLPTWLEAMRPIESFKADKALVPEDDQSVESIGPLAGLRGVLAAEPIMAMPRTATIGGARLEVSEQQYARAELLANMVQAEQQEQAKLKPHKRRIPLARLLVTLALLAALFFSLPGSDGAAGNRFLPPENQPQSLNNLYDMVANAPLDRPVLVVFDYSPAYAGELETYAAPILADIVNRDLKIITVSTHPTGPALAARMLQNVSGERELQNTRDYMHFGYLSGGPTAVQLFAANPRQALLYGFQLPVGTQTTGIWSYPIVENIEKLSDFGMLVVITAGTDSARTWVEQAGPYLGDTPIALVLSAGVEPLLQPYAVGVEPQIDNILSGLPVAYVYEGYMGFNGTARTNWDAFGSMLTVVELILIGGAIYGLASYILRVVGVVKE